MPKSRSKAPAKPARKQKRQGPKLSVRVTRDERDALREIVRDARKIRPYVNHSDVMRELLGLTYTGLITPEMRKKLRDLIERLGTGGREHDLPQIEGPNEYKADPPEEDDEDDLKEVA